MRLLLLGYEGAVGRCVTALARQRGDQVQLGLPSEAPEGAPLADAVVWAAGDWPGLIGEDLTREVHSVVARLERNGPARLVFLSWLGAVESRRQAGLVPTLVLARLLRGPSLHEAEAQERRIRESTLDWTIVRPGRLEDGPRTGRYRTGFGWVDVPDGPHIARADAADFLLREVDRTEHVRTTVDVFY